MLLPALTLAISVPAAAQNEIPAPLRSLRPHQIVEAIVADARALDLTSVQQHRLDSLHLAIRSEPHRYEGGPAPGKAHRNTRMRPMISGERAFADALAILTPEQRARARARFSNAAYRLPSELGATAAADQAGEPLRRHAPAAAPTEESTQPTDTVDDPLLHDGGATPQAVEGDRGKPADPVTHRP
jgi:hypothetical protein